MAQSGPMDIFWTWQPWYCCYLSWSDVRNHIVELFRRVSKKWPSFTFCSGVCHKSWVATRVLCMRLLHVVAFSKKLRWLAYTKVIALKTQQHAVNARWKRLSQLSFTAMYIKFICHNLKLSCDSRFQRAFSKKLRWLAQTKVITLKTQLHAVIARWKRLSQLSLIYIDFIYRI
jgi:hypothetical protein